MHRRSEHSLLLSIVCFVFFCLLMSGGSRLIGAQGEAEPLPERAISDVRAALVRAPAPGAETDAVQQQTGGVQRHAQAPENRNIPLKPRAVCDANGNVLAARPYLRTVYQAFALGDGFV